MHKVKDGLITLALFGELEIEMEIEIEIERVLVKHGFGLE